MLQFAHVPDIRQTPWPVASIIRWRYVSVIFGAIVVGALRDLAQADIARELPVADFTLRCLRRSFWCRSEPALPSQNIR